MVLLLIMACFTAFVAGYNSTFWSTPRGNQGVTPYVLRVECLPRTCSGYTWVESGEAHVSCGSNTFHIYFQVASPPSRYREHGVGFYREECLPCDFPVYTSINMWGHARHSGILAVEHLAYWKLATPDFFFQSLDLLPKVGLKIRVVHAL